MIWLEEYRIFAFITFLIIQKIQQFSFVYLYLRIIICVDFKLTAKSACNYFIRTIILYKLGLLWISARQPVFCNCTIICMNISYRFIQSSHRTIGIWKTFTKTTLKGRALYNLIEYFFDATYGVHIKSLGVGNRICSQSNLNLDRDYFWRVALQIIKSELIILNISCFTVSHWIIATRLATH